MDGGGDAPRSGVPRSLRGKPAHSPRIAHCAWPDFASTHIRTRLALDEERFHEVRQHGGVMACDRRVTAAGSSGAAWDRADPSIRKFGLTLEEFTWQWDSAFSPSPACMCC